MGAVASYNDDMRLWLAEKASAGRDIAKALGGGREENGSIVLPNGDVVVWARGHLLESCAPDDYDPAYKKWKLEDLPIVPDRIRRKPESSTTAILNGICRLLKKANEVVIATDAGREGEAIAWLILEHAGWKGRTLRFWTSSLNQSHLKTAVNDLLDASVKKPLYVAARLRASADWLDGINFSRYYQLRAGTYGDRVISVGRVQTAVLALIVDRDREIENFKPTDYFELRAGMDTPAGPLDLFHRPAEDKRILRREDAEALADRARGTRTTLKVETKPKSFAPPPPFSLPQLQMSASSKWGWGAKKTLDVLQTLYEKGAVTYPRTDSSCLTEDMVGDMPKHLSALRKRSGLEKLANIKPIIRKSVFDNSKVEDHHGIIPTDEAVEISSLGPDAGRLFDLIARRFLASLMPDAKGMSTVVSADLGGVPFRTTGLVITEAGWKAVWGKEDDGSAKKDDEEQNVLPPVKNGDPATTREVHILAKTTQPPAHYTEGTLLKAMINVGAKVEDKEIKDLLSGGGIGTQATRQDMIEKVKQRAFAKPEGKKIVSTQRGREFIDILRTDRNRLAEPLATADLERQMRAVEKDPKLAQSLWLKIADMIRTDIDRLKRGPAPRKLTPVPDGRSGGAGSGTTRGSGTRTPAAAKRASPRKSGGAGRSKARGASGGRARTAAKKRT